MDWDEKDFSNWRSSVEDRLKVALDGVANFRRYQEKSASFQEKAEKFFHDHLLTEKLRTEWEQKAAGADASKRQADFEAARARRWRNGFLFSALSAALLSLTGFLAYLQYQDHESVQEFRRDIPQLTEEIHIIFQRMGGHSYNREDLDPLQQPDPVHAGMNRIFDPDSTR